MKVHAPFLEKFTLVDNETSNLYVQNHELVDL